MCGIAGILGRGDAVSLQIVGAMTRAIAYRGPDDEGVWLDREAGVAFADEAEDEQGDDRDGDEDGDD